MPAVPRLDQKLDHAAAAGPRRAALAPAQAGRGHLPRGAFAYITSVLRDGQQIPVFRLRHGGSAHSRGFAIYSAAHGRS